MHDTGMRVTQLWRYPVKSMAGQRIERAEVSDLGIEGDRRFGIVDLETGLVLTARRVPDLLFARVADLGASERPMIELPDGTVTDDDRVLSEWLDRSVELRRASTETSGRYEIALDDDDPASEWVNWDGPQGVFHDSTRTRVSIISEEAIGDWDVRRFRANVIVSGGDERELLDHTIRIGTAEFQVVKETDRCVVVTRPQPGVERDKSVLVRVHRERSGNLGVGTLVQRPGTISVGDPVLRS